MAPELEAIVVADPPEAWEAAGFAVAGDGTCRVGSVRVELAGPGAGRRIVGWSLSGVPAGTTAIDGLATTPVDGQGPAGAGPEHPNGVVALDHLVVLTPDSDRTVDALAAVGVELRRTREVPAERHGTGAVQTFYRLGQPILEVVGPRQPSGDGPARFWGLAWTVADLDALARRLGDALGPITDAVQPGRRIATLRHEDVGVSVPTAFMSK